MKRKVLSVMLCAAMVVSMTACGGRTDHLYTDRMVTVRGSGSGIWTVVKYHV